MGQATGKKQGRVTTLDELHLADGVHLLSIALYFQALGVRFLVLGKKKQERVE